MVVRPHGAVPDQPVDARDRRYGELRGRIAPGESSEHSHLVAILNSRRNRDRRAEAVRCERTPREDPLVTHLLLEIGRNVTIAVRDGDCLPGPI